MVAGALRAARIAMFSIGCIWFFPQDVKEHLKRRRVYQKVLPKGKWLFFELLDLAIYAKKVWSFYLRYVNIRDYF